ncbi:MAG: CoB--CoM heterodisulfide reductase iron-sulfur subunit A family protein, partial [Deltaproteobacteria bacterium]|nr:CoB--CoM heterodisulfide reductase iron-sulfur subunit A family protein [Deltaproteobacteria bacterium]
MSKKVGCYIYTGDGIAEALDIDKLVEVATGLGLEIVRTHADLYSPEGVAMVKQDIANEGVNAVVLAGISPRYKYKILDFPDVIVEKASLRELVTWSHPVNPEDENAEAQKEHVQELAEDYIRMSVVKAQKSELAEPFKTETEEINQRLLVIGGGVTGLTAALETAEAGHESILVERQAELGGWGAKLRKQVPIGPDYSELINPVVQDLIDRVNASDKITVKTNTEVARIGNFPGDFRVSLK